MRYTLRTDQTILRDDGVIIPVDPGNRHYQEYVEWIEDGNFPELAEDPPPAITVEDKFDALLTALEKKQVITRDEKGKIEQADQAALIADHVEVGLQEEEK